MQTIELIISLSGLALSASIIVDVFKKYIASLLKNIMQRLMTKRQHVTVTQDNQHIIILNVGGKEVVRIDVNDRDDIASKLKVFAKSIDGK